MSELYKNVYNPDVLSCLANLSNDEVFTPPEIANQMLDMLPKNIWSDPNVTFLDPACKSGVFLREIAKRLIGGLKDQFSNEQECVDHIFHKQLFGIAITELTSLLSRRSVYCSKNANGKYSVSRFDLPEGNIRFERIDHTWKDGKCIYCGASEAEYDRDESLETHAYQFIHVKNIEDLFKMKFDVIIGNPPYQLSDGGAQASAKPIYHKFIEQAKKLNPRFLTMIIPARWMTGGKGLDKFRLDMIQDKHICILHDFANSKDLFHGVDIKGGICYFLWQREHSGQCECYRHNNNNITRSKRFLCENGDDIFIREKQLIDIRNKVWEKESKSFKDIVSSRKPYGLCGDFFSNTHKYLLPEISNQKLPEGYKILGLDGTKRSIKYVEKTYPIPKLGLINNYKVFMSEAYGSGEIGEVPSAPIIGTPGTLCTETFLEIGPLKDKKEARNVISYISTKLFRALVGIAKQTQHTTKKVYRFVPMQDFSEKSSINWSASIEEIDIQLYKKYNLTEDDIAFLESSIKPMNMQEINCE